MNRDDIKESLLKQGVDTTLLGEVDQWVQDNPIDEEFAFRIPKSIFVYHGKEIWESAIYSILSGYHILLSGPKATGKNVLSENLCQLFARPMWNMSLNVNADSSSLIGVDSFKDGEVVFKKGPITLAAEAGGFALFDEINMAKNESLSVVHSALDFRRIIDIPGYERIALDPGSRFIATMNYGYMGTRELNEALVSRFMVIQIPILEGEALRELIESQTDMQEEYVSLFARLFGDLQEKSLQGEISSKAVDLRGMLGAIDMIKKGLSIKEALNLGLTNKSFDQFEREIISDVIDTIFPPDLVGEGLF